jgi:hypothetical protein
MFKEKPKPWRASTDLQRARDLLLSEKNSARYYYNLAGRSMLLPLKRSLSTIINC